MPDLSIVLGLYLVLINACSLALMCLDKLFAKKGRRRIPEATLLLSALLGGSAGAWLGMYLVRHKTRRPKFYLGVPAILLCQLLAAWLLWKR